MKKKEVVNRKIIRSRMKMKQGNNKIKKSWHQYRENKLMRRSDIDKDKVASMLHVIAGLRGKALKRAYAKLNRMVS